jgi:hypothetical protein
MTRDSLPDILDAVKEFGMVLERVEAQSAKLAALGV